MNRQRNEKARCKNCPHLWRGKEKMPYGFNSTVEITMLRCTKNEFNPTTEELFCDHHPDFWEDKSAGFKE